MDPRLVKGLIALAAVGAAVGAQFITDASLSARALEAAAFLFGWVLRRPGDTTRQPHPDDVL